jgi:IclR family pca regulon transcriptional regulator
MANPAARADNTPTPGDGFVQSFARGLAVIRTFSADAPEQTLSEVASRSGLTRAGARRILLTLQTLGYVHSDGKWFRLTPRILELGFAYLSSLPVWNLAQPVMEQLTAEVKESCSAAVLDGTDIVYVVRVHTHKIMSLNLAVGSRLPAYCTSMGRVLLAGLPDAQVRDLLAASDRPQRTRHTLTGINDLLAAVQQVRQQGWCVVDQELEEGLVSMAAPITNRRGETVAALNISGPANRTDAAALQRAMLPALRAAADTVSRLVSTGRG